jgi:hypothetical protein
LKTTLGQMRLNLEGEVAWSGLTITSERPKARAPVPYSPGPHLKLLLESSTRDYLAGPVEPVATGSLLLLHSTQEPAYTWSFSRG